MKNRFLPLFVVLFLTTLLLTIPASAATTSSGTCGDNLTWTLDDQGVLTISGSGTMTDYDQTANCGPWEPYSAQITSIIVDSGVKSIGYFAFNGCENVVSAAIPASVIMVGDYAFGDCTALEEIFFYGSALDIGSDAFLCVTATCYYPGDNDTWTEDNMLQYEGTLTWKPYYTGTCGDNLTWLLKDGTLTIRGEGEMEDFDSYDDEPWYTHRSLIERVVICEGVTTIGNSSFMFCRSLVEITIPSSVLKIGATAFYGCNSLPSVEIPVSAITIAENSFHGCPSIEYFVVDPQNKTFSAKDGVLFSNDESALIAYPAGLNNDIYYIPENVAVIGNYAFSGCTTDKIVFQGNAPSVGDESFVSSPATVYYPADNPTWTEAVIESFNHKITLFADTYSGPCGNSVVWTLDMLTDTLVISGMGKMEDYASIDGMPWYSFRNCIKAVVVESGVSYIGSNSFSCFSSVCDVTLAETVTEIGKYAFSSCSSLSEIMLPSSLTTIGNDAFHGSGLRSILIPDSVTDIKVGSFANCSELTNVYIGKSVERIDGAAFAHNSLSGVVFYGSAPEIQEEAFISATATVYYPGNNKTWTADKLQPYGGTLTWVKDKPEITAHPETTTVKEGKEVTLSVTAEGNGLTYQWYVRALEEDEWTAAIAEGNQTATLTFTAALDENGYQYYCAVTGITGTTTDSDIVTVAVTPAWVDSGTCGDNLTWTLDDQGVLTISGTGAITDDSLNSGWVPTFPWHKYATTLTALKLNEGITSIGDYAFYQCTNLKGTLTIPNSVTTIGNDAFYRCSGFTGDLVIPDGVVSIGDFAFDGCSGFTGDLTIPNGVTEIGSYAFQNCSGFTGALTISNSITEIADGAFYGCSGFTGDLTIPDSVISIGGSAFFRCSGFTGSLTIPNSVTSIGDIAFGGCSGFTGVLTIPDSITAIGRAVFGNCSGFTGNLTIPDSVTSIGPEAFAKCSGFTGDLTIPNNVTSIGDAAFWDCSGFTGNLTIPDSITSIGYKVFSGCSGFTDSLTIPNSVTSIGSNAFYGCSGFTGNLTIPSSVTSIGGSAFYGCSGFTGNLTIPNSVTSIGGSAFEGCSGFTGNLTIPNSVTSIGGSAFEGCSGFTGNLTIPDSVTSIGYSAFHGCSGFDGDLTIPNSVTSIGDYAFWDCSGFTGDLTIPDSVTKIGDLAFAGCSNLMSATIYSKTATFDNHIFPNTHKNFVIRGYSDSTAQVYAKENGHTFVSLDSIVGLGKCGDNLNWVLYDDGMLEISGTGAMSNYSSSSGITTAPWGQYADRLKTLTFNEGISSIGDNAFYGCSGLTDNLTIPSSVTSIGTGAFSGCSGFSGTLIIPNGVTEIRSSAFSDCSGFTNATIYSKIATFGEDVFANTPKSLVFRGYSDSTAQTYAEENKHTFLAFIDFGKCGDNLTWMLYDDGLLEISGNGDMDDFFPNDRGPWSQYQNELRALKLNSGITSIGNYAFYGCTGLTGTLTIPDGVTRIGKDAFYYCTGFTGTLTLPDTITTIDRQAFIECSGFTGDLTIPSNVTYIDYGTFSGCSGFTGNLTISNCVTKIGDFAFSGCSGFTGDLTIPNSVTSIGNSAFSGCSGLTGTLTIPSGVTSIGECAFSGCSGFSGTLTISNGVTSIGNSAFSGCDSLTSVTIPGSVASIGTDAFYGCDNLKIVVFTGSAPSISSWAFNGITATVAYPAGDASWTEAKRQNYGGSLTWLAATPPVVLSQPENVFAYAGETAVFSIWGLGDGLTYQWEYRVSPNGGWAASGMPGNKTDTLTVPVIAAHNGYQYRCVITDSNGKTAVSDAATLTAVSALAITTQPVSAAGKLGDIMTFTVSAQGIGLAYQWQQRISADAEWTNLADSNVSTLNVPLTATRVGYQFRCVVMDKDSNSITSDAALLTVGTPLTITQQPTDVTINTGSSAEFSIVAKGEGLNYQWQRFVGGEWLPVFEDNTTGNKPTFQTVVVNEPLVLQIRCVVTDKFDAQAISNEVTLTVMVKPEITEQPKDATVYEGAPVVFTAGVTGENLIYQWEYFSEANGTWRNTTVPGCNTPSIALDAIPARNGLQYRCKITDSTGASYYTDEVTLKIASKPEITKQPGDVTATEGTIAIFSVEAEGEDLTYQWQYYSATNGTWRNTTVPGCNTPSIALEIISARDGLQYRCMIIDGTGTSYYTEEVTLTMEVKPELIITSHPESVSGPAGTVATFSIEAEGEGLTYQWQYYSAANGTWRNTTVPGCNTPSIALEIISARDGLQYRCIVSDAYDASAISEAATLTMEVEVLPELIITSHPESVSGPAGTVATFSIEAEGEGLTYQWQYYSAANGTWRNTTVPGCNTPSIALEIISARDGLQYRCMVSDAYGASEYSDAATLNMEVEVLPELIITSHPESVSGPAGTVATFSVEAEGDGLTYQWQYYSAANGTWRNTTVPGCNTPSIALEIISARDGLQYRCIVSDVYDASAISEAATLTMEVEVLPELIITSHPESVSGPAGTVATFSVEAEGEGLTYQWQYYSAANGTWRNTTVPGCNTPSITLEIISARDGLQYRCMVSDAYGASEYSDAATLNME